VGLKAKAGTAKARNASASFMMLVVSLSQATRLDAKGTMAFTHKEDMIRVLCRKETFTSSHESARKK
jgi:hypothetical protein